MIVLLAKVLVWVVAQGMVRLSSPNSLFAFPTVLMVCVVKSRSGAMRTPRNFSVSPSHWGSVYEVGGGRAECELTLHGAHHFTLVHLHIAGD